MDTTLLQVRLQERFGTERFVQRDRIGFIADPRRYSGKVSDFFCVPQFKIAAFFFYRNWEKELSRVRETKEKPELLRAIKRTFLKQYVVHGIVLFLQCVVLR